jgi:hypothetical protein
MENFYERLARETQGRPPAYLWPTLRELEGIPPEVRYVAEARAWYVYTLLPPHKLPALYDLRRRIHVSREGLRSF